ncbi:MAG TPA: succinyl-diaminopimelate desuccinylase, partial [Macromonas sp.]|nr:succinyl-diaminopimelate desuccinylase [Macromonas sp.]
MTATLQLTEALIARASVTPEDAACQHLIAERLSAIGFACETLASGPDTFRVTNLWAKRPGRTANAPVLVWAG